MNWSKTVLAGIVAGVVAWLADYVMHVMIMGSTYMAHPAVFSQEEASPLAFLGVEVCAWIAVAILFAKTRGSWGPGWMGGATYGFWWGVSIFFLNFYHVLVIADFPYHLAWCWGGINVIVGVIGGAVLGAIYKS